MFSFQMNLKVVTFKKKQSRILRLRLLDKMTVDSEKKKLFLKSHSPH